MYNVFLVVNKSCIVIECRWPFREDVGLSLRQILCQQPTQRDDVIVCHSEKDCIIDGP